MYLKKVGLLVALMVTLWGCSSEVHPDSTEKKEEPSYEKYQQGLENQQMN